MNSTRYLHTSITALFVLLGFLNPLSAQEPAEELLFVEDGREAEAEEETVLELKSDRGSIRFGLALQMGMDIYPNQLSDKQFGFSLHRARLQLTGHVAFEGITYQLTGDPLSGVIKPQGIGYPGGETLPLGGELEVPFLLDARINWHIQKMGIKVSLGRFIPKWGLSMPEEITNLGAINYPLYVYGGMGSLGRFRCIGVEAEVELTDHIDIGGGIFNGGLNTWLDENNRKDILFFVSTDFLPGLRVVASSMFAFPEQLADDTFDISTIPQGYETHIRSILEARYTDLGFDVMAGVAHGAVIREIEGEQEDYAALGVMAHLGYVVVGDWFQIMGRFERWEPDSQTSNDEQIRLTVGPQLLIKGKNLQINLNYIQDLFASSTAMCRAHLNIQQCQNLDLPDEARKQAATILVQLTLAL